MPQVEIHRQSVCMADDMDDHVLVLDVDENARFIEVFQQLIKARYFPQIHRNDVVWVMVYGDDVELASYQTLKGAIHTTCAGNTMPCVGSWFVEGESRVLLFRYFSSREKRAFDIFRRCGWSYFSIAHGGYIEEYESYKISKWKEYMWRHNWASPLP